ncbi:hypothetical protein QQF64_016058 [Cirrhinus molitorella]|uniref:Uncharacterized protein n=1 Tax=Cirrhinus molitorella TaxID=172907 RepID=A0ABR3LQ85_9TELE
MQYVSSLERLRSHKQHAPASVLAPTCLLIRNLTMTNQATQMLLECSSSPSATSQIQELLAVPQRRHCANITARAEVSPSSCVVVCAH